MNNSQLVQLVLEPTAKGGIFGDKPDGDLFADNKAQIRVADKNWGPTQVSLREIEDEESTSATANAGDHGAAFSSQNDTEPLERIGAPEERCAPEDKRNEEDELSEVNGEKEEDEDTEVVPFRTLRLNLPKASSR